MVLLLAAILAATANPPPHAVSQRARASITIVRAHRASQENWEPGKRHNQREVVKEEPDGAVVRLRLTEFE